MSNWLDSFYLVIALYGLALFAAILCACENRRNKKS